MLAHSVPRKDSSRFADGPLLAASPHGGENSSPRGPVGAWRPHISSTLTARKPVSQRPLPGGSGLHHRGFGGNTDTQSIAHGHSGRSPTVSGAGFNQIALCGGPLCVAGSPARPETCGRPGAASALCVGLAPAVRSLMYRAVGCDAGRGPADSTTLVTHGEDPSKQHGSVQSLGSPAARADWVIQWEVLSSAPVNGRGHWALSALTLFGVGARPRGGMAMCLRSQAVGGRCGAPSWPPKPKACCSWWYSRRQVRFPTLPLKDEEPGFPWAPRGQQAIRGARSAAARTCLWPQELGAPDSTVGIRAELLPESRGARSPPLCPPP